MQSKIEGSREKYRSCKKATNRGNVVYLVASPDGDNLHIRLNHAIKCLCAIKRLQFVAGWCRQGNEWHNTRESVNAHSGGRLKCMEIMLYGPGTDVEKS